MNATREQIITLLLDGLPNTAIARQLGCDRHRVGTIRRRLNLPNVPRQLLSLDEKWAANSRAVEEGHIEWTGEREKGSGTPVLRYQERSYSPAGLAFRRQHGREPKGYVYAECGFKHCVAPSHVDDQVTRSQTREQLRYLTGGQARKGQCVHGHDLSIYGRYETDGRAYCHACKLVRKAVSA